MTTDSSARGFWTLAFGLAGALALVAGILGVMGARRGPDLVDATLAVERAVAAGGQQLVLRGRQPLDAVTADQVSITPAADFTVESRDAQVIVRLTRPLAYATDYTVTVTGLRSRHTGIHADWTYSFTTPGYAVYSLLSRGPWAFGADDRVVRTEPGGDPVTVLATPGIEAYTVVADMVVAIAREGDLESRLVVSAGPDSELATLATPAGAAVGLLGGSPEQGLVGYTVTGEDAEGERFYDNTLFLQDMTDLAQDPREIAAADGGELRVTDWAFIPGTRSLVLQDDSGQVFLTGVDPGSTLAPLGSHDRLLGFLPGTTTLVVLSGADESMLDLGSGKTTALPSPGDAGDTDVLAGNRTMITPAEWVQQFDDVSYADDVARITSRLEHTRDGTTSTVATVSPELGRLLESGVSSNGQYAWTEILDVSAPVDDLTSGATDHSVTAVIDLGTGESLFAVPGGHPLWVAE
ncbi:MAG: hypothetical protein LCH76_09020 [Actinobacteria bacterium]|nr:hypothetical protein [Actinomycetota bacterium]